MAKDFQTSFIPASNGGPGLGSRNGAKKNIFGNFLFGIVLIIFIATATLTGYSIWRENTLNQEIEALEQELIVIQQTIVDGEITNIERMNTRLEESGVLLKDHVSPAILFNVFEKAMLPTLTFTKFNFDVNGDKVKVTGSGLAANFESIVHQSDVLGKKKHIFKDVLFSNLQRNVTGSINFSFSTFVNRKAISYLSQDFSKDDKEEAPTELEVLENPEKPEEKETEDVDGVDLNREDEDISVDEVTNNES